VSSNLPYLQLYKIPFLPQKYLLKSLSILYSKGVQFKRNELPKCCESENTGLLLYVYVSVCCEELWCEDEMEQIIK
jgi:hypothetical protein